MFVDYLDVISFKTSSALLVQTNDTLPIRRKFSLIATSKNVINFLLAFPSRCTNTFTASMWKSEVTLP